MKKATKKPAKTAAAKKPAEVYAIPALARMRKQQGSKCGDELSELLDGVELREIFRITMLAADCLGITHRGTGKRKWEIATIAERWGHLNRGMQRMNAGNVLRSMVRELEETGTPDYVQVLAQLKKAHAAANPPAKKTA
jgi:hypothetical protein